MNPTDAALAVGATMRLSRVVTTDEIGEHYVHAPAHALLRAVDAPEWVGEGLDCPFCVGYWLGVGVLGSYAVACAHPAALAAWRFVAAGLALNYVVGHVSSRLDA